MATSFNTDKNTRSLWIQNTFGTRRVFVAYVIFVSMTVLGMIANIVTGVKGGADDMQGTGHEKLLEHFLLCVSGLFFLSLPVVLHRKYKYRIPSFIYMSIAFVIFAHFILGEIYRFYDNIGMFDKLLHITGGITIALCGFSIVYGFSKTKSGHVRLSPFFTGMFSFCFAMTLLVLWEFFEYWVDMIGGFNMQRWRDSLSILAAQSGEMIEYNFKLVRAWPWQDGLRIAIIETGDTIPLTIQGPFPQGENGVYLLTKEPQGYGLIDTMNDLIIGAIGALVVSIVGAIWINNNPDDKKILIVRDRPKKIDDDDDENIGTTNML